VTNVLEVSGLSVRFGQTRVLQDLSFTVPEGTSLAVIGPNGAGKTVLFRALIGAVPSDGTIRWGPGVRIGYVPQKLDIERDIPITGADFLRARMALDRTSPSRIVDALALVGLSAATGRLSIGALSGGQFQRLLIAFALVGNPTVLLLDEPTAGVDEPGQEHLNELVHRLQREQRLTVLVISHELTVVNQYASAVLCLNHDRTWFGPPNRMLTPDLLRDVYGTPMAFHVHDH
jgi:zinc transport system ATP-binding protein